MKTPKTCGIYQITNTVNGRFYIGKSIYIPKRWEQHRGGLNGGGHHCWRMLKDWKKHGEAAFRFDVIENCGQGELAGREVFWIETLKPQYNGTVFCENTPAAGNPCEQCQERVAVDGERFCRVCRLAIVKSIRSAYPPLPRHRRKQGARISGEFRFIPMRPKACYLRVNVWA